MNDYGILIKKFRESRNMTQLELAKEAEIGSGTIGDIERGARKGKQSTLKKISDALKLTKEEREKLDNAFLGKKIKNIEMPSAVPSDIVKKLEKLEEENKNLKEKYSQIDERVLTLDKKGFSQYEKTMNEASLFFQDENISDEDKQKMVMAISELFFESKQINKEKYKKNKKDDNE